MTQFHPTRLPLCLGVFRTQRLSIKGFTSVLQTDIDGRNNKNDKFKSEQVNIVNQKRAGP